MAETAAPSVGAATAESTRGLPYYEKLKRDLREVLHKKRLLDKNLALIEEKIYASEAQYLEETGAGNIIKGFDNYTKGSSGTGVSSGAAGGGTSTRRKGTILEHDRVFSRSSASFMRESSPPSSARTTPSHAPTPTSAYAPLSARESNQPTPTSTANSQKGTTKKIKKVVEKEEEESEDKPKKRQKFSFNKSGD